MSKQRLVDKVKLLGVEVDAMSNQDAIEYICNRSAPEQPSGYVVKPYVEFLDQAYRRQPLQQLLNEAELSLPDGVSLTWAAAFLYAGKRNLARFLQTLCYIIAAPTRLRWPLPDRAAGITFTWPLLIAAAQQHRRIYLVGSPQHNPIEHTAKVLQREIPELIICGTHAGRDTSQPAGTVSDHWLDILSADIKTTQPDIILVGAGFPLQEKICAHLANKLNHGIFIGEGGTFDYERFGGQRPKAPIWVQRSGLEWLWRLAQEPKRLGRQLAIPRFIFRIWRNK